MKRTTLATILGFLTMLPLAGGAFAGPRAARQTTIVTVKNGTAYTVAYTVEDAYEAMEATIGPGRSARFTAVHDGSVRTWGTAYDAQGDEAGEFAVSTHSVSGRTATITLEG